MEYKLSETKSYNGTPCHNSCGRVNPDNGHSVVIVSGRSKYHHIVVWESFNGAMPKGHTIHHLCFNKICVNNDHLQLLTWSEHSKLHNTGENNPRAILTEDIVRQIRNIKNEFPGVTNKTLANVLGMSESHISAFTRKNPERWRHI